MAGEDPGVGVITLLLDLIQRGWSAVTGVAKSVVGGIMDIVKTSLFFSWRRKMMQGQKGPDLERGEQSLKDLRLHEQVGARIVTVEIGDEVAMEALRQELKRLELDFAITEHEDQYTLHYKEVNEQDVLYAQQMALEALYGTRDRDQQNGPDPRDEQERDDQDRSENQDRQDRQDDDRDRDEREERQGDERREEQEHQNQQDRDQRDEPAPTPIPAPVETGESHSDEKASRGKHARQEAPARVAEKQPSPTRAQHGAEAPSLAERMPAPPSQSQNALKTQAQAKSAPQFEPLENLIAQARERAAAKNAGRSRAIDRTKDRIRAREVNFGH